MMPKLVIPERVHCWAIFAAFWTDISPSIHMFGFHMSVDVLLSARLFVTNQALKLSQLSSDIALPDLVICRTFVPISSSTLHGHASVGVDHARSVIVATVTILAIVVRLISVRIVQGDSVSLWLLLHRGVGDLLSLVVGYGLDNGGHGGGHCDWGHGHGITRL